MSNPTKKVDLFNSEAGLAIEQTLIQMTKDKTYNTNSSYSANVAKYPDNRRSFVDKHMDYLKAHPTIDPNQYIANLRLISRIHVVVS